MIPASFRSTAELNLEYARVEPKVIRFIASKADAWVRTDIGLDRDDLIQEGRCALLHAISTYDPKRGKKLHQYLGRILDNTYTSLLAAALAQKRTPHIWECHEDGTWEHVPYRPLSIDGASQDDGAWDGVKLADIVPDERDSPLDQAIDAQQRNKVRITILKLYARLSPMERDILDCKFRPPAGLIITTRNLSGSYVVGRSHIAAYLGITKNNVEHAMWRIRTLAAEILTEDAMDELLHESLEMDDGDRQPEVAHDLVDA